jgi:hypothetical protein
MADRKTRFQYTRSKAICGLIVSQLEPEINIKFLERISKYNRLVTFTACCFRFANNCKAKCEDIKKRINHSRRKRACRNCNHSSSTKDGIFEGTFCNHYPGLDSEEVARSASCGWQDPKFHRLHTQEWILQAQSAFAYQKLPGLCSCVHMFGHKSSTFGSS